jgi:hypothetical protein
MKALFFENISGWALRRFRLDGSLLLVAIVLVLVGGASVASAAEFQQGSYSGMLPRGDKVVFKFDGKAKFVLADKDGKALVEGTYKVTKDQIEFIDETGPMASKGAKPGKYKWKLEATKLSFTKVEDASEGRSKGITGTTWTLEK